MILLDTTRRHCEPEVMDDPHIDECSHQKALHGLARINRWSGSTRIVWRPIRDLARSHQRPIRVLDVAAGAGDVAIGLWRRAQRAGLSVAIDGCDVSEQAVAYARQRATDAEVDVRFFRLDVLAQSLPRDYDVIMTSLFLHHLADEQAVHFLRAAAGAARCLVLVNDLIRSRRGLLLAHLGTRILSRSRVVHIDGPRSVRAAYTLDEVKALAGDAGLSGATLCRRWPCRFLLTWMKT